MNRLSKKQKFYLFLAFMLAVAIVEAALWFSGYRLVAGTVGAVMVTYLLWNVGKEQKRS
ncbi:hypothetical protein M0E87_02795 [Corynebacterium sp. CCM 9185]|uniref:Secreted protein n=1 Tax=Corynebacterium marambiense TaxID=2765364 RepID=A0ABS0VSL5_9CORY|nr:hypothetical protein [Corynebacterium marambiense]MBI8999754.1 hypothetical protein [Corynebacterium marambiense]MCK7662594.1 hypothetical protein [Corynebacterium marambiense]